MTETKRNRLIIAAALLGGVSGQAPAQSTAPADSLAAIPEKVAPGGAAPATDLSTTEGSLSHKLSTTNGVIHPKDDVDPAIQKPAPATGTMPVITPPGSPGGSSDVQPK